ncbi:unnamed protein product [Pipistrellus nathusii]|uniref:Germinal center-associated signaling and motility-like protein n=1 Tax=Pipistrellus nathusii TaxID=59473 RepID=A0ABP0A3T2_PIPNA
MGNCLRRERRQEMTALEKENRGQEQESNEVLSTSNQENEDGSGSEEVSYTVIVPRSPHKPSVSSNDNGYENIDSTTKRVKLLKEGTETEYAILRTACTTRPLSRSGEPDYELVLPH